MLFQDSPPPTVWRIDSPTGAVIVPVALIAGVSPGTINVSPTSSHSLGRREFGLAACNSATLTPVRAATLIHESPACTV